MIPASPLVNSMIRFDLIAFAAAIVVSFCWRALRSVSGIRYIFRYSYVRLPLRYISRYKLLLPLANSFVRRRIGSFTFIGFLVLGIFVSFYSLFPITKVQIKNVIKKQTRNKNAPKKSKATENVENN